MCAWFKVRYIYDMSLFQMTTKELINLFSTENCKDLAETPKLFFFHMCRKGEFKTTENNMAQISIRWKYMSHHIAQQS